MSGSTRLLAPKRNLCILYCLPFCASVLDAVIFNTSIVEYKKPNDNTKTKKILKNISILTPEMQLPPSSGVSPIPFPLCTLFEGTHGTALRGGGDTLGTRIEKYRSYIMPLVRQRKEQHSLAHLYYSSSLALDAVGALRLHATNNHIPFISTPQTSFRFNDVTKNIAK